MITSVEQDGELPRGTLLDVPLGPRRYLGIVWQPPDGACRRSKAEDRCNRCPGYPRLPEGLCDFIDWVARYTLTLPGIVLAMALRSPQAFEPEGVAHRLCAGNELPQRMTPPRERVLDIAADGLARSVAGAGGRSECLAGAWCAV